MSTLLKCSHCVNYTFRNKHQLRQHMIVKHGGANSDPKVRHGSVNSDPKVVKINVKDTSSNQGDEEQNVRYSAFASQAKQLECKHANRLQNSNIDNMFKQTERFSGSKLRDSSTSLNCSKPTDRTEHYGEMSNRPARVQSSQYPKNHLGELSETPSGTMSSKALSRFKPKVPLEECYSEPSKVDISKPCTLHSCKHSRIDSSEHSKPSRIDSGEPSKPSRIDSSEPSRPSRIDSGEPSRPTRIDSSEPSRPSRIDSGEPSRPSRIDSGEPSRPSRIDSGEPSRPTRIDSGEPSRPSRINYSEPSRPSRINYSEPSRPVHDPCLSSAVTSTITSHSDSTIICSHRSLKEHGNRGCNESSDEHIVSSTTDFTSTRDSGTGKPVMSKKYGSKRSHLKRMFEMEDEDSDRSGEEIETAEDYNKTGTNESRYCSANIEDKFRGHPETLQHGIITTDQPLISKPQVKAFFKYIQERKQELYKGRKVNGKYHCKKCKHSTPKMCEAQNHHRVHTGGRPYQCLLCNYKAKELTRIKGHVRVMHKDIYLDDQQHHLGENLYCGVLQTESEGQKLTLVQSVDTNDQQHHIDRENLHRRAPWTESDNPVHEEDNGNKDQPVNMGKQLYKFILETPAQRYKPKRDKHGLYKCHLCKLTNSRLDVLKDHYRTHTGVKPYHCKLCDHRSKQATNIRTHVRKVHKGGQSSNGPASGQNRTKEGEQVRTERFQVSQDTNMRTHVRQVHRSRQSIKDPASGQNTTKQEEQARTERFEVSRGTTSHSGHAGNKTKQDEDITTTGEKTVRMSKSAKQSKAYRQYYKVTFDKTEKKFKPKPDPSSGLFHCHYCRFRTKNLFHAVNHHRIHTGACPYQCMLCPHKSKHPAHIANHIKSKHKERLLNDTLDDTEPHQGSASLSVQFHEVASRSNSVVPTSPGMSSSMTSSSMASSSMTSSSMTSSSMTSSSPNSTEFPELSPSQAQSKQTNQNRNEVKEHCRLSEGISYQCRHCDLKCGNQNVLIRHLRNTHKTGVKTKSELKASMCAKSSKEIPCSQDFTKSHPKASSGQDFTKSTPKTSSGRDFRKSTPKTSYSQAFTKSTLKTSGLDFTKSPKKTSSGRIECPFPRCYFSHRRVAGIEAHIRIHTKEPSYFCGQCLFSCYLKSTLVKHLSERHSGSAVQQVLSSTNESETDNQEIWEKNSRTELPNEENDFNHRGELQTEHNMEMPKLSKEVSGPWSGCEENLNQETVLRQTTILGISRTSARYSIRQQAGNKKDLDSIRQQVGNKKNLDRNLTWKKKHHMGKARSSLTALTTRSLNATKGDYIYLQERDPLRLSSSTNRFKCVYNTHQSRWKSRLTSKKSVLQKPYVCCHCAHRSSSSWEMKNHVMIIHKVRKPRIVMTREAKSSNNESSEDTSGQNLVAQIPDKLSKSNCDEIITSLSDAIQVDIEEQTLANHSGSLQAHCSDTILSSNLEDGTVGGYPACIIPEYCSVASGKQSSYSELFGILEDGTVGGYPACNTPVHCSVVRGSQSSELFRTTTSKASNYLHLSDTDDDFLLTAESADSSISLDKSPDISFDNSIDSSVADDNQTGSTTFDLTSPMSLRNQGRVAYQESCKKRQNCFTEAPDRSPSVASESTKVLLNCRGKPPYSKRFERQGFSIVQVDSEKAIEMDLKRCGHLQCPQCGVYSNSIESNLDHFREHTGYQPYLCNFCGFQTGFEHEVKGHIEDQIIDKEKMKKLYTLKSDLGSKMWTKIHRNEITGEYKCPDCTKEFGLMQNAKQHFRVHTKEKPYHCNLCDFRSSQHRGVFDHIKLYHRKCIIICPKSKENHDSRDFISVKSAPKVASGCWGKTVRRTDPYNTPKGDDSAFDMEQSYQYKVGTVQHFMRLKMKRKAKELKKLMEQECVKSCDQSCDPFSCPFCNRGFKDLDVAILHVGLHTGEKPYTCILCDFTTVYEQNMMLHGKQVHGACADWDTAAPANKCLEMAGTCRQPKMSNTESVIGSCHQGSILHSIQEKEGEDGESGTKTSNAKSVGFQTGKEIQRVCCDIDEAASCQEEGGILHSIPEKEGEGGPKMSNAESIGFQTEKQIQGVYFDEAESCQQEGVLQECEDDEAESCQEGGVFQSIPEKGCEDGESRLTMSNTKSGGFQTRNRFQGVCCDEAESCQPEGVLHSIQEKEGEYNEDGPKLSNAESIGLQTGKQIQGVDFDEADSCQEGVILHSIQEKEDDEGMSKNLNSVTDDLQTLPASAIESSRTFKTPNSESWQIPPASTFDIAAKTSNLVPDGPVLQSAKLSTIQGPTKVSNSDNLHTAPADIVEYPPFNSASTFDIAAKTSNLVPDGPVLQSAKLSTIEGPTMVSNSDSLNTAPADIVEDPPFNSVSDGLQSVYSTGCLSETLNLLSDDLQTMPVSNIESSTKSSNLKSLLTPPASTVEISANISNSVPQDSQSAQISTIEGVPKISNLGCLQAAPVTTIEDSPKTFNSVSDKGLSKTSNFVSGGLSCIPAYTNEAPPNVSNAATTLEGLPKISNSDNLQTEPATTLEGPLKISNSDSLPTEPATSLEGPPKISYSDSLPTEPATTLEVPPKISYSDSLQTEPATTLECPPKISNSDSLQTEPATTLEGLPKISNSDSLQTEPATNLEVPPKISYSDSLQTEPATTLECPPKISNSDSLQTEPATTLEGPPKISNSDSLQTEPATTLECPPKISNSDSLQTEPATTLEGPPKISNSDTLQTEPATTLEGPPKISNSDSLQTEPATTLEDPPKTSNSDSLQTKPATTLEGLPKISNSDNLQTEPATTLEGPPKISNSDSLQTEPATTLEVPPKITNSDSLQTEPATILEVPPKITNSDSLQIDPATTLEGPPKISNSDSLQTEPATTLEGPPKISNSDSLQTEPATTLEVPPKITNSDSLQIEPATTLEGPPRISNSDSLQTEPATTLEVPPKITNSDSLQIEPATTLECPPKISNSDSLQTEPATTLEGPPKISNSDSLQTEPATTLECPPKISNSDSLQTEPATTLEGPPKISNSDTLQTEPATTLEGPPKISNSDSLQTEPATTLEDPPKTSNSDSLQTKPATTLEGLPKISNSDNLQTEPATTLEGPPKISNSDSLQTEPATTLEVPPKITNSDSLQTEPATILEVPPKITNSDSLQIDPATTLEGPPKISNSDSLQTEPATTLEGPPKISNSDSLQTEPATTLEVPPKITNSDSLQIEPATTLEGPPRISNSDSLQTEPATTLEVPPKITNSDSLQIEPATTLEGPPKISNSDSLQTEPATTLGVPPKISNSDSLQTEPATTLEGPPKISYSDSLQTEPATTLEVPPKISNSDSLQIEPATTLEGPPKISNSDSLQTEPATTLEVPPKITNSDSLQIEPATTLEGPPKITNSDSLQTEPATTLEVPPKITNSDSLQTEPATTLEVPPKITNSDSLQIEPATTLEGPPKITNSDSLQTEPATTLEVPPKITNSDSLQTEPATTLEVPPKITNSDSLQIEPATTLEVPPKITNSDSLQTEPAITLESPIKISYSDSLQTEPATTLEDPPKTLNSVSHGFQNATAANVGPTGGLSSASAFTTEGLSKPLNSVTDDLKAVPVCTIESLTKILKSESLPTPPAATINIPAKRLSSETHDLQSAKVSTIGEPPKLSNSYCLQTPPLSAIDGPKAYNSVPDCFQVSSVCMIEGSTKSSNPVSGGLKSASISWTDTGNVAKPSVLQRWSARTDMDSVSRTRPDDLQSEPASIIEGLPKTSSSISLETAPAPEDISKTSNADSGYFQSAPACFTDDLSRSFNLSDGFQTTLGSVIEGQPKTLNLIPNILQTIPVSRVEDLQDTHKSKADGIGLTTTRLLTDSCVQHDKDITETADAGNVVKPSVLQRWSGMTDWDSFSRTRSEDLQFLPVSIIEGSLKTSNLIGLETVLAFEGLSKTTNADSGDFQSVPVCITDGLSRSSNLSDGFQTTLESVIKGQPKTLNLMSDSLQPSPVSTTEGPSDARKSTLDGLNTANLKTSPDSPIEFTSKAPSSKSSTINPPVEGSSETAKSEACGSIDCLPTTPKACYSKRGGLKTAPDSTSKFLPDIHKSKADGLITTTDSCVQLINGVTETSDTGSVAKPSVLQRWSGRTDWDSVSRTRPHENPKTQASRTLPYTIDFARTGDCTSTIEQMWSGKTDWDSAARTYPKNKKKRKSKRTHPYKCLKITDGQPKTSISANSALKKQPKTPKSDLDSLETKSQPMKSGSHSVKTTLECITTSETVVQKRMKHVPTVIKWSQKQPKLDEYGLSCETLPKYVTTVPERTGLEKDALKRYKHVTTAIKWSQEQPNVDADRSSGKTLPKYVTTVPERTGLETDALKRYKHVTTAIKWSQEQPNLHADRSSGKTLPKYVTTVPERTGLETDALKRYKHVTTAIKWSQEQPNLHADRSSGKTLLEYVTTVPGDPDMKTQAKVISYVSSVEEKYVSKADSVHVIIAPESLRIKEQPKLDEEDLKAVHCPLQQHTTDGLKDTSQLVSMFPNAGEPEPKGNTTITNPDVHVISVVNEYKQGQPKIKTESLETASKLFTIMSEELGSETNANPDFTTVREQQKLDADGMKEHCPLQQHTADGLKAKTELVKIFPNANPGEPRSEKSASIIDPEVDVSAVTQYEQEEPKTKTESFKTASQEEECGSETNTFRTNPDFTKVREQSQLDADGMKAEHCPLQQHTADGLKAKSGSVTIFPNANPGEPRSEKSASIIDPDVDVSAVIKCEKDQPKIQTKSLETTSDLITMLPGQGSGTNTVRTNPYFTAVKEQQKLDADALKAAGTKYEQEEPKTKTNSLEMASEWITMLPEEPELERNTVRTNLDFTAVEEQSRLDAPGSRSISESPTLIVLEPPGLEADGVTGVLTKQILPDPKCVEKQPKSETDGVKTIEISVKSPPGKQMLESDGCNSIVTCPEQKTIVEADDLRKLPQRKQLLESNSIVTCSEQEPIVKADDFRTNQASSAEKQISKQGDLSPSVKISASSKPILHSNSKGQIDPGRHERSHCAGEFQTTEVYSSDTQIYHNRRIHENGPLSFRTDPRFQHSLESTSRRDFSRFNELNLQQRAQLHVVGQPSRYSARFQSNCAAVDVQWPHLVHYPSRLNARYEPHYVDGDQVHHLARLNSRHYGPNVHENTVQHPSRLSARYGPNVHGDQVYHRSSYRADCIDVTTQRQHQLNLISQGGIQYSQRNLRDLHHHQGQDPPALLDIDTRRFHPYANDQRRSAPF